MSSLTIFAAINKFWYLVPLVAVISLVYCASRYESPDRILRRSGKLFTTIMVFMVAVLVVLFILSHGI